jgi:hypothetical protein
MKGEYSRGKHKKQKTIRQDNRMNRISNKTLFKDPVNPVILSGEGFVFFCFCGIY